MDDFVRPAKRSEAENRHADQAFPAIAPIFSLSP